jgi:hypothetical protein
MALNKEGKKALENLVAAAMMAREATDQENYERAVTELFGAYQDFRHCQTWEEN